MSTKYNLLESVNTGDEQAVEVCCSSRNKELLFVQLKETGADGCTPLLAAAREGHEEILKMLLESGADTAVVSAVGDNGLHLAAMRNHVRIMKRLVQAGVDNEAKGEFQNTPLHVACGSGSVDAVRLLLRDGVLTTPTNSFGNTPLEIASLPVIKALIQADRTGGYDARMNMLDQLDKDDKEAAAAAAQAEAVAKEAETQRLAAIEAARMRWDAEDAEEDRIDEEARLAHEAELQRIRDEEAERLRLEEEERLRLEEEARQAAIAAKKARLAAKKAAKK